MGKTKLNIRFHNPNSEAETIKYILPIFVEASRKKFERILRETVKDMDVHKQGSSEK